MRNLSLTDTIAAIATPVGESGIGIVRISGKGALSIADKIFVSKDGKKPSDFKTYTVHYGWIINLYSSTPVLQCSSKNEIIDEVILTVMRAPKSYTKEDIVEINCHGGIQAVKKTLELVLRCGARLAEPGEFTKRAFLNGRIDLAQAESVLDIVRAKTEGALKVAMNQLEGGLSSKVNEIRDKIIDIASHIEASIDFPEEDLEIIKEEGLLNKVEHISFELKGLIDSSNKGIVLREGVLAVICGKPNVGKSSLMNLLLKRDRVIVTPIPGTTRDAVEETINLNGVPIRLVDTAGIAQTKDLLDEASVKKSKSYLELSDLVLFMLDASTKIEGEDLDILKLVGDKKKLVIINKCDLTKRLDKDAADSLFKNDRIIKISVEKRQNIEFLEEAILDMVWKGGFNQGESTIVTNSRHKELLDKSFGNMLSVKKALSERFDKGEYSPELVAIDLKEAIFHLGLIVGKAVSDDILGRIFENFCIGK